MGQFVGTSVASALSRSALFAQVPVPVIARFSAARNARGAREMELEFRLSDGSLQHMAMLNTPVFGTADPVTFGEMIVAAKPDPYTGRPDLQRLRDFSAAHPDAFAQTNFVTSIDPSSSYAGSTYFSIHTFRFIDDEGRTHFVRWRFVPQDVEMTVAPFEAARTAEDVIEEGFSKPLGSTPVRWDMIVYVGQPADSTDNASIGWPEDRTRLMAGTLTITRVIPQSSAECGEMHFDPLIVADGIAPTDDPVLLFRSPAYGLAFSKILAQALVSWRTPAVFDE
jgi:catalase